MWTTFHIRVEATYSFKISAYTACKASSVRTVSRPGRPLVSLRASQWECNSHKLFDHPIVWYERLWRWVKFSTPLLDEVSIPHYMVSLNSIVIGTKSLTAMNFCSPNGFVRVSTIVSIDRKYSNFSSPVLTNSRHTCNCVCFFCLSRVSKKYTFDCRRRHCSVL